MSGANHRQLPPCETCGSTLVTVRRSQKLNLFHCQACGFKWARP